MRALACLLFAALLNAETPAEVFNRAVTALKNGDYSAAEAGIQQVLKASPEHIGALQNLGLVYSNTGRLELAIATCQRALILSPDNQSLLLNLAIAYMKRESYVDALPVFRKVIQAHPESPAARDPALLHQFAAGYLKQNQSEGAWRTIETFLAGVPMPGGAFVLCQISSEGGRYEEAAAQCRKTLAADPAFAGAHRELGKALVGQHSPDAIGELTTAVQQDPNDPQAAYYLGVALLADDRPGDASRHLDRARQLDPNFWGTYFYLGKTRWKLKQLEQAIPLLQKAAELNPGASAVFYELGAALQAAGRHEEAARAMDRVRELRALELERDIQALRSR